MTTLIHSLTLGQFVALIGAALFCAAIGYGLGVTCCRWKGSNLDRLSGYADCARDALEQFRPVEQENTLLKRQLADLDGQLRRLKSEHKRLLESFRCTQDVTAAEQAVEHASRDIFG